jgi:hypothetical protein
MQFALPPRKSSHPTQYPSRLLRLPYLSQLKRRNLQLFAVIALSIIATFYGFSWLLHALSGSSSRIAHVKPAGTSDVVLVTMIDRKWKQSHIDTITENRLDYAAKHGSWNLSSKRYIHTDTIAQATLFSSPMLPITRLPAHQQRGQKSLRSVMHWPCTHTLPSSSIWITPL